MLADETEVDSLVELATDVESKRPSPHNLQKPDNDSTNKGGKNRPDVLDGATQIRDRHRRLRVEPRVSSADHGPGRCAPN